MKIQIIFLSILLIHLDLICCVKGAELPDDFCRGINTGMFSHPDNCFQFIICNMQVATIYTCPHPTPVFNYTRCVEGYVEGCIIGTTAVPITTTKPETSNEPETSTETITQIPTGPPELCYGNNLRFVPNPHYCFRFYFCNLGTAVPYECAPDNIFDEQLQGCIGGDWETCKLHTTTAEFTTFRPSTTTPVRLPPTTPIPVHRCPPGGFGYIPHHTNCSRYFECIKGIRHMRFCPEGLLFDSITLQCKSPELAVCAGGK